MKGEWIGLVAVVCIFGIPIVWLVADYLHSAFKIWQETSLKRDMVARGYTAQEIIEVVSAGKGGKKPKGDAPLADVPPAKPIKQAAHA